MSEETVNPKGGEGQEAIERPDHGAVYDDATLLDIIAHRFGLDADPITRRDAAWIISLARKTINGHRTNPSLFNCACRAPSCICLKLVAAVLCEFCVAGDHINSDLEHYRLRDDGMQEIQPCPAGCEEHGGSE